MDVNLQRDHYWFVLTCGWYILVLGIPWVGSLFAAIPAGLGFHSAIPFLVRKIREWRACFRSHGDMSSLCTGACIMLSWCCLSSSMTTFLPFCPNFLTICLDDCQFQYVAPYIVILDKFWGLRVVDMDYPYGVPYIGKIGLIVDERMVVLCWESCPIWHCDSVSGTGSIISIIGLG